MTVTALAEPGSVAMRLAAWNSMEARAAVSLKSLCPNLECPMSSWLEVRPAWARKDSSFESLR